MTIGTGLLLLAAALAAGPAAAALRHVDPASTLRVQSAWWERSRPPDAAVRLADELRLAARWQGLESISVARWGDAADDVADALPEATRVEGDRAAAALSVTDARDEAADVEAELDVEAIAG